MIAHQVIVQRAKDAGYEEPGDYACDRELWRCDVCGQWGLWGDEVVMGPYPDQDFYCPNCHPDKESR